MPLNSWHQWNGSDGVCDLRLITQMTSSTLMIYSEYLDFKCFKKNDNALGQHNEKALINIITETTFHDNSSSDQSVHLPVCAFWHEQPARWLQATAAHQRGCGWLSGAPGVVRDVGGMHSITEASFPTWGLQGIHTLVQFPQAGSALLPLTPPFTQHIMCHWSVWTYYHHFTGVG